jgi:uncharacterized protein (DUF2132 family)
MEKSNDPLHGLTLKTILEKLVAYYGFDTMSEFVKIKCFIENPSIKSSLTFLRKTDWARKKVEELYIKSLSKL